MWSNTRNRGGVILMFEIEDGMRDIRSILIFLKHRTMLLLKIYLRNLVQDLKINILVKHSK